MLADNSNATVDTVARQLLGLLGPEGVDFISLQKLLLIFLVASMGLRQIFRNLRTKWPIVAHPERPTWN